LLSGSGSRNCIHFNFSSIAQIYHQKGSCIMRLFGWFRHNSQQAAAEPPASTPRRWGWLGGRRVLTNTPYILPKDKAEGDRLDLQHHLFKVAVGASYRAPVRTPRAILDVACGTGVWGREMALKFKRAQVIGFDIDRTPLEAALARLGPAGQFPPNFHFLEADALQPFPFEDESFDFTHARAITGFVPIARWPDVIREMVRVTKRGGYIELTEPEELITPSPAFKALSAALQRLVDARGLHGYAGPYLVDYMRQAGLQRVQQRRIVLGEGQGLVREQRMLVADILAVLTNMQPIVVKTGLLSEAEYSANLERAKEELPRMGLTCPVICAFSIRL
jgi:ubiquinone/menaquinone biosynthesis C-methylase UbiE